VYIGTHCNIVTYCCVRNTKNRLHYTRTGTSFRCVPNVPLLLGIITYNIFRCSSSDHFAIVVVSLSQSSHWDCSVHYISYYIFYRYGACRRLRRRLFCSPYKDRYALCESHRRGARSRSSKNRGRIFGHVLISR